LIEAELGVGGVSLFDVRFGTTDDAAAALGIWRGAASFWIDAGQPLWSVEQFRIETITAQAHAGQLVVGEEAGAVTACMIVENQDRLMWRDAAPGEALYLHKLAARRTGSGQWASRFVGWAVEEAGRRGIDRLRLDCTDRPALIRIYEAEGFVRIDDRPLMLGDVLNHRFERLLW
jgi:hypothetical protein